MELGEKIRSARLEKGLSQRQLCGDTVTRNMLSQIENGSARPSMDTLRYFAGRLGKPVSWFLEEPGVDLPNFRLMAQLRAAFAAGEYRQVLALLKEYQGPDAAHDSERYLLEALSLMEQAALEQAEKPVYARGMLEQALAAGEQTPYFTRLHRQEWVLRMAALTDRPEAFAHRLQKDDRALLLRAQAALAEKDWARAVCLLEAAEVRDARWQLLRGHGAMGQKDYRAAAAHYLQAEESYPRACAEKLEICYRELEDFKLAYTYACKLRQLP